MSDKLMPMLIVKTGTVSKHDMMRAEKRGGILIIQSADPTACRFVEPPIGADIDPQARAALQLMRAVITGDAKLDAMWSKGSLSKWWAKLLIEQSPPLPVPKPRP